MPDDHHKPARPDASGAPLMKGNSRGEEGPFYGHEYDSFDPQRPGETRSAGASGGTPLASQPPAGEEGEDIPPQNGLRASVDTRTGEVHGSGVGAGGGQPGEDYSSDAGTGDGYPLTGGEGTDHTPGDHGAHEKKGGGYL